MSMPPDRKAAGARPRPGESPSPASRIPRKSLFATGLILLAVLSWVALRQPPRPDPYRAPGADGWESWLYPVERHAFLRLASIDARLNAVAVSPDGSRVWAAGERGVIVRSDDLGRTWEKQEIDWSVAGEGEPGGGVRGGSDEGGPGEPPATADQARLGAPSLLGGIFTPAHAAAEPRKKEPDKEDRAKGAPPGGTPGRPDTGSERGRRARLPGSLAGQQGDIPPAPTELRRTEAQKGGPGGSDRVQQEQDESVPEKPGLNDIFFVDGDLGWAAGDGGTILHTTDGGRIWARQDDRARADLHAVRFDAGGEMGWAVGQRGTVLVTSNGGRTWDQLQSRDGASYLGIHLLEGGRTAWVAGSNGTILRMTLEKARLSVSPKMAREAYGSDLRAIKFSEDGESGWIAGGSETRGIILETRDWGRSWSRVEPEGLPLGPLFDLDVSRDGLRGWGAGESGAYVATRGSGDSWSGFLADRTPVPLYGVRFIPGGRQGWAVGGLGRIQYSRDGGASWSIQTVNRRRPLRAGSPLVSEDLRKRIEKRREARLEGGDTVEWSNLPAGYRRYPAPWFWASAGLVILLLVVPALRAPPPSPPAEPSVADMLASDRPLEPGDPDPLDFDRLASGISRFLANKKTEPPLTVAVTGDWGSGKSSLMNLVRGKLHAYGYPTVWFNAWHHQTEEHLLASLMEGIQQQAIPGMWSPRGLAFRARLLFVRGARQWIPVSLLTVLFFLLMHHFVADDFTHMRELGGTLATAMGASREAGTLESVGDAASRAAPGLLEIALALVAPLMILARGVRTFGSTTSPIVSAFSGAFHLPKLGMDTGFRQKFAVIFKDVTRAFTSRRRLTIFIDDLDRCAPDKAVRALEMINFLVSSGDCYVVLGMAPDWVVRAVGLGFKDMAAAMDHPRGRRKDDVPAQGAPGESPREIQDRFARNYLEKLINVEVPVPAPDSDQAARLLVPPGPRRLSAWESAAMGATGWTRRQAPLLAFGLLAAAGWLVQPQVETLLRELRASPGTGTPLAEGGPGSPGDSAAGGAPPEGGAGGEAGPQDAAEGRERGTGQVAPGERHRALLWPWYLMLAGIGVAGTVHLARRPLPPEEDSETFQEALATWEPLLFWRTPTPRSMKRYLNRVRFYAMCQRQAMDPPSRLAALRVIGRMLLVLAGLGRRKDAAAEAEGAPGAAGRAGDMAIPEDILVALSALEHLAPEALEGETTPARVLKDLAEKGNLPPEVRERMPDPEVLRRAEPHLETFRRYSEGVTVRR